MTESTIRRLVRHSYGSWEEVAEVRMQVLSGRMKGQAFLHLDTVQRATALRSNLFGCVLEGRPLIVQYAKSVRRYVSVRHRFSCTAVSSISAAITEKALLCVFIFSFICTRHCTTSLSSASLFNTGSSLSNSVSWSSLSQVEMEIALFGCRE